MSHFGVGGIVLWLSVLDLPVLVEVDDDVLAALAVASCSKKFCHSSARLSLLAGLAALSDVK